MNTKDVHSSVGTMFVCSFLDSQDVKVLQGPFANKMFASVHAALGEFWKTYFEILADNFGEMLEIMKTFLRYFEIILWNCLEYFYEIS